MRLSKSSLLYLFLSLSRAGGANAAEDWQPAPGIVPWESSEIARLWSKAKADYAAKNYDAAIATANSYLDLVEPDAQMQALLGKSYFREQLYVLAAEHLRGAIAIATSRRQPVPTAWIDLLRRSGGGKDETPDPAAPVHSVAAPNPHRKSSEGGQASMPPPLPEQSAATERALLLYRMEAQLAQAQARALSQIRDAQTAVGRARAEATPPDQYSQIRAIQQQRQHAQSEAFAQLQRAQSDAESARAESQISRIAPVPQGAAGARE